MEQAIIALVSLSVAVTFYLDRGRRAAGETLEDKLDERFGKLEQTVDKRFDKVDERFATVEQNLEEKIGYSAARTDARINDLNRSVIGLAQSVGRAEGRTETLAAVE